MAGATAFFTTFALPPIIFILVQLFGVFIGRRMAGRGLMERLTNVLGAEGAEQVRAVIRSIRGFSDSWYVIVFGFLFLVFVATTLFTVIRNSLNQVWNIRVKEHPGIWFLLGMRGRAFAVILMVGILFFADLILESIRIIAGKYFHQLWPGGSRFFDGILNEFTSIVIVGSWFILLFRFLADAKPSWRASIAGGIVTGILFSIGRVILKLLLVNSNIGSLYGAGGSFVLLLLFVFYSSFILYFGASFIAVYSHRMGWPLEPGRKAFSYRIEAVDGDRLVADEPD